MQVMGPQKCAMLEGVSASLTGHTDSLNRACSEMISRMYSDSDKHNIQHLAFYKYNSENGNCELGDRNA